MQLIPERRTIIFVVQDFDRGFRPARLRRESGRVPSSRLAGVNALVVRLKSNPIGIAKSLGQPYARIAGAISVFSWKGAVVAGRWIAFT